MKAGEKKPLVFLDACCLINLLATGRIREILSLLPYRFAVSRYVAEREVLRVDTSEGDPPEVPNPAALAHDGILEIFELQRERELAEMVRFATVLDDGEASICALATIHRGTVATDDRKALAVLGRWEPEVQTLETPSLLREWATLGDLPREEVISAIRSVRTRARFAPRRSSPDGLWWWDHLG